MYTYIYMYTSILIFMHTFFVTFNISNRPNDKLCPCASMITLRIFCRRSIFCRKLVSLKNGIKLFNNYI